MCNAANHLEGETGWRSRGLKGQQVVFLLFSFQPHVAGQWAASSSLLLDSDMKNRFEFIGFLG